MRARGFTLVEVIVALAVVGVGITGILVALAQGRRNVTLTVQWAAEERRASDLLFERLEAWQHLRSEVARTQALTARGQDPVLGAWEWRAVPEQRWEGRAGALYRVQLAWGDRGRHAETEAVLRAVP